MDQIELQQKIALYYSKLPPNAQVVFASMSWLETLKIISTKYTLNEEQIQTLSTETTLVLLGIIHLQEYEEIIKKDLKLPEIRVENILEEIENSILKTIRPELVKAFNTNIKSEEGLDERFKKLPTEIQSSITASNYQAILYTIGGKYKLTVEQIGALEEDTTKVILGTIYPENFEESIKKDLGLVDEKTKEIVKEINELVFKKIRTEFMKQTENKTTVATPAIEIIGTAPNKAPTQIIKKEDNKILQKAGIELVLPKDEPSTEIQVEKREDMLAKIENPEPTRETEPTRGGPELIIPATPAPKILVPTQTKTVKTEYSLNNLSKSENTEGAPSYLKNKDPYRLSPDE